MPQDLKFRDMATLHADCMHTLNGVATKVISFLTESCELDHQLQCPSQGAGFHFWRAVNNGGEGAVDSTQLGCGHPLYTMEDGAAGY